MDQLYPVMLRNKFQSWSLYLQCKKRCLFFSSVTIHRKHLGPNCFPFLYSTSWVTQAFLITNQVKHLTLVGMLLPQKIIRLALSICISHLETSCVGTLYRKYPISIVFPKTYINLCTANWNMPYFPRQQCQGFPLILTVLNNFTTFCWRNHIRSPMLFVWWDPLYQALCSPIFFHLKKCCLSKAITIQKIFLKFSYGPP